jgi:hypothetical protein
MINEVISSHSLRKTAEPTPFTEIDSKHRNPLGSFLLCFAGEAISPDAGAGHPIKTLTQAR